MDSFQLNTRRLKVPQTADIQSQKQIISFHGALVLAASLVLISIAFSVLLGGELRTAMGDGLAVFAANFWPHRREQVPPSNRPTQPAHPPLLYEARLPKGR